ncbi:alpha-L-arabinofuranosidase [Enterococcus canis]|uniref:Alpha-L-arabinofuranosidase n=1 Tax=Enterococcus canis TaxID=214095 RepID=A0A1L8RJM7_9ENTE|nr:glycoside hydrolase family 43 protein [Enterococcus canis]OJG19948.1 alpha-L-arabinofuranosidase [Enterococcus canis]
MTLYNNPIVIERADPWIFRHTDGYYYFMGSVPGYQEIELRRARHLNDLENAERKIIWRAHEYGEMSRLIWAPEIHFLNGKWYVYFAASDDEEIRDQHHHHRMFVLENSEADPFKGIWTEKGKVNTQFDSFSLDGTVFTHKGMLYYVWAQLDPAIPGNSNLYLSKMENPWTLTDKQVLLSIPEYDWEKRGFWVNEGPAVIERNGKVFITYSASATDENYCMGLLWAEADSDLLDGYSWHKSKVPVFQSSEENQQFGPGHNSFTKAEDNETDLIVYHARPKKNDMEDPLNNPDRHARVQEFKWNEEGFPIFGEPVAD